MKKFIIILYLILSLGADEEYELGEGIQVGSLPFYLGGYISLEYKNMDNYERYRLDDLALLGYGSYNKFSYLMEIEYKELYAKTYYDSNVTTKKDTTLYVERVYLDYDLNENGTFRVGKYNSPIGFWNLLPINVLRETTSNPQSTYMLFPKFTTGLDLSYTTFEESEFKLDVMIQRNEDLDDEYNNYKIDEHYALGVSYEKYDYALKLNGGYFHNVERAVNDELYYFLLSGKYETQKYQFLAELGSQASSSQRTTEYAGYVQGLYRFSEKHIVIGRVESYDDKLNDMKDDIAIAGYTYRPLYPIALKTEYQFHSTKSENQFLFSLSVLF